MIGRMNRYKGIEILLKAITEIEVNLYKKITFAGKINYDLEKYLSPQIEWIDKWLSPQEIADLLTEHDIMIIPYPEATQSGVLTLAIAAEMPIVCTNVGGLAEQVTSEEAIIVLPDSTSLKTGIQALLIDADLYRNLHLRLKIKRANASWQHIATKIELIISQMLDNETAK
jgi:glycosyltransferase involved in cell wall biosynthesis